MRTPSEKGLNKVKQRYWFRKSSQQGGARRPVLLVTATEQIDASSSSKSL